MNTSGRPSQKELTGTTAVASGLSVGDEIVIEGADDPLYDGTFTVTAVPTSTTFTYTMTGTPSADASGSDISMTPVSLDNVISRVDGLQDHGGSAAGSLVAYTYLGTSTFVQQADGNGVTLSYITQSGDSSALPTNTATSGGDRYTGLDRFGRVVDQNWFNSSGTVDRLQYGYDADGNALYRDNIASSSNSELYGYDTLNRLTSFARGTLNSSDTAISGTASATESWSLDALGNWDSETTNGSDTGQTITSQNPIAAKGGNDLTYDYNGNMLTDDSSVPICV
jgi:hypothetical protein